MKRLSAFRCVAFLFFTYFLSACSSPNLLPGRTQASAYAKQAGWSYAKVDTGRFSVAAAFSSVPANGRPLTVYLEGDGRAFSGASTPSADPTPATPVALRMALLNPTPAAWVARPCQYTDSATAKGCAVAYWTSHRYAPEIIESIGRVVDDLKQRTGAQKVVLVGYSGGGAVAALLAARRTDVTGFVTVAANLDLGYWTRADNLAPLSGSLDPVDDAQRLRGIPQIHFVGGQDDVVPPAVVRSYLSKLGSPSNARLVEKADYDHQCCWIDGWSELVRRPETAIITGWR
ncbi:alpha/beta fold hydrolase [Novispirillum itersonii]|uniref:alpha/beta fold hydrolase n=1 Tax=Novispirillum itersonii TaxID=189 RepID=UPI0012DD9C43|nr:alpha/beta fold hydrolase [Novispirillum itersonii]